MLSLMLDNEEILLLIIFRSSLLMCGGWLESLWMYVDVDEVDVDEDVDV